METTNKVIEAEITPTSMNNTSSVPVEINKEEIMKNIPVKYREQVSVLSNQIQLWNYRSVENFGSELATAAAEFTSNSSKMIKVGEAGNIGEKLNEMMKYTKSFDPSQILNKQPNFLTKLFTKVTSPIEDFKNKKTSVYEAIKTIGDTILLDKQKLLKENDNLEQMFIQNEKNIELYNVLLAAGSIRVKEIETELSNLAKIAGETKTQEDLNKYRDGQNFLRQLESRVDNINSARSIAILQSPSIRDMQNNNAMQCEVIQTMVTVGIPAWEQQIAMYISQLETKKSIEMTKTIKNSINETMRQNAALMNENSIAIAEAANSSLIEYETIETIHKNLISSMEKVKEINEKGKQKRLETSNKLLVLEKELREKMLK